MTTTGQRTYMPFTGDLSQYGSQGEHMFFMPPTVSQAPTALAPDQPAIAWDPSRATDPAGVLNLPQMPGGGAPAGTNTGSPGLSPGRSTALDFAGRALSLTPFSPAGSLIGLGNALNGAKAEAQQFGSAGWNPSFGDLMAGATGWGSLGSERVGGVGGYAGPGKGGYSGLQAFDDPGAMGAGRQGGIAQSTAFADAINAGKSQEEAALEGRMAGAREIDRTDVNYGAPARDRSAAAAFDASPAEGSGAGETGDIDAGGNSHEGNGDGGHGGGDQDSGWARGGRARKSARTHGLSAFAVGGPTWSGSLYDTGGAGDYLLDETQPDDPLLRAATYGSRFGAPMSGDYAPVDLPTPETWGTVVAPIPRQSVDLPNDARGQPVARNGDDLAGIQPPALMGGGPDVVAPIPQDSRPKSVTPLGVQVPIQPQSSLSPEFLAAYQRVIGTTPTDPSVPTQPATIGSQTQETRTPQDAGTTTEMPRSPGQSSGAAQPDAGMTQAEIDQRMFDIPGMVKYDQAPAAGVAAVANKGAQQQRAQAVRAKIQKAMTAARDISRMTATLAPNASLGDAVAYYGGANKLPQQWRQRAGLGPTQTAIAPGAVPQAGQLYARGGSIKLPKIGPAKGIGGALDQMRTPVGLIDHASPGRADRVVTSLPQGGFVIPADTVSGLGQGNTLAGAKQLDGALGLTSGEQRGLGAYADGGQVHVRVAGGEYHIPPDKVAEIGHGDLDKGHQILHDAVLGWRKNNIRTLQGLPGPKR